MKINKINFYVVLMILLKSMSISAQSDPELINKYLKSADHHLKNNNLDSCEYYYEEVLDIDENNLNALSGLGKMNFAKKDWGNLKDYFNDVIDLDTNNIEAMYYLGIGYRESGTYKVLLLRRMDWNESEDYFRKVITIDSTYRDVFYQYALLNKYDKEYEQAIDLAQNQIRISPVSHTAYLGLCSIYMSFIRNASRENFTAWMNRTNYPESRFFYAELQRRSGELEQAKKTLKDLIFKKQPIPVQLMQQSLTKIYYEQNFDLMAENYYWQSVENIKDKIDADILFEGIKYIINQQEYRDYQTISEHGELTNFYKVFWQRRNPIPASKLNYRLKEHYSRLVYAERNYEYDGFRIWFNNPDDLGYLSFPDTYYMNQELNDKGLIYIRFGEPDAWARTPDDTWENESWKYYAANNTPEMIFHFMTNTPGNNWRFAPFLKNTRMMEDRITFDYRYAHYLNANDEMQRLKMRDEIIQQSMEDIELGLISVKPTWAKNYEPLNVQFQIANFKADSNKSYFELFFLLNSWEFRDVEGQDKIIIECGISIDDTLYNNQYKDRKKLILRNIHSSGLSYVDFFRTTVPPGTYKVNFYIQTEDNDFLGAYNFISEVQDFHKPFLSLSSIYKTNYLGPAQREGISVSRGVLLRPNPSKFFPIDKPLFLVFEIYNLALRDNNKTEYTIDIKLDEIEKSETIFDSIANLFSGEKSSALEFSDSRTSSRASIQESVSLNLNDLDEGRYQLILTITDHVLNLTEEKKEEIIIYRPEKN